MFGVAPSLVPETFGGVVVEAMAAQRAVIASSLGGPLDTIEHGETGLLVPPGDIAALTSAMQTLVDNPALRERMGITGRLRAERLFSTDVVIPQFEAFYRDVLAVSPPGGAQR
jgi:glycosyltransferase involved in cell wall biosynthesis